MVDSKKSFDKKHDTDETDPTGGSETEPSEHQDDMLVEVMGDNLDLMFEVCMKIREDPDYAKSIYADCPRLQHLLDNHPDLRPIFEEPNLVRINFDEVYRKAGGDRLPEDKPSRIKNRIKRTIACIVTHPLFKIFRFLIAIKKIAVCITGGGVSAIRSLFVGACFGGTDEVAANMATQMDNVDEYGDADGRNHLVNEENLEALNRAADYMEANSEQMQKLLECSPDELDDLIEQDPELKALRDANPLCSELMSDQSTLKILIDPDNLRALGECPDLIEADFADPQWTPPEVEPGVFDEPEIYVDTDAVDQDEAEFEVEDMDDGVNLFEDYEAGEKDDIRTSSTARKKGEEEKEERSSRVKGLAQQGLSGLFDTVIGNAVGVGLSELTLGGEDGLDALIDEAADDAADEADNAANILDRTADVMTSDEVADKIDHLEGAMDMAEDKHDQFESKVAASAAKGGVIIAGGSERMAEDEEDEDDTDKKKKKGLGGIVGAAFASAATATKEFAIGAVLGEDLAEDIVERMEESEEEDEGAENDQKEDKSQKSTRQWGAKRMNK